MPDDAELTSIHQMTPRVKQFQLTLQDASWDYKPGQHTVIHFEKDGEEVARPYTPTNYPNHAGKCVLAIKRYDGGTASVYLHDRDHGDIILMDEPHGNLYLRDLSRDVAFIATGTGITPMVAMLKQYVHEGEGDAYFFFGERTQEDIMYRETLDQLEAEHDNIHVIYSLSHEEWSGREGFIQEHLEDVLDSFDGMHFYVCGVPQMVVDTKELLFDNGVDESRFFSEGWEEDATGD